MKIKMSKRKSGIYNQWFEILGENEQGKKCTFLIYQYQAKTYALAWNEKWGNSNCKAFLLRNAEPVSTNYALAC